ncbi:DUF2750 domain-containing protein [Vibrio gangliei]|uniref:DUF2750 domain-containing protein n=1 Tax=Vibrio gangliei TaxID=2077090 RepID=UPI000D01DCCB|nr:DUF2750 domain-containing protein [Vibrio gangliei]
MTQTLDTAKMAEINAYDSEKRFQYCIKEVVANRQIWILVDEDGCVMLNTEDEDCVPVWPNQEFAQAWANGDWEECKPEAISLNKWHSRWTHGLEDDDLSIVVFPNADQEGVIVFPDEFDFELKKQAQKR